jgi:hypothetical protein
MSLIKKHFKGDLKFTISTIIAIGSILFTIYSQSIAEKRCQPVFIVDPVRMQLIDRDKTSDPPFIVMNKDSTEIEDNIILVRFYFYNYGKKTLRIEDVPSKPLIGFENENCEILSHQILVQTDPEKVEAQLSKTVHRGKDELEIKFLAIEKDEGFTGQLIYTGSINERISISGTIIDSEDIITNVTIGKLSPFWWKYILHFAWGMTIYALILGAWASIFFFRKKDLPDKLWAVSKFNLRVFYPLYTVLIIIVFCVTLFTSYGKKVKDMKNSIPSSLIESRM